MRTFKVYKVPFFLGKQSVYLRQTPKIPKDICYDTESKMLYNRVLLIRLKGH